MVIRIKDIPAEGLLLSYQMDPLNGDLSEKGFKIDGPVDVSAKAIKHNGDKVYLRGMLTAEVASECGRCLKQFKTKIESDFHAEYLPRHGVSSEMEKELSQGDLAFHIYEDDTIDIDQEVEEQLILSIPMRPLCREECRGLCPQCGEDLNLKQCACPQETIDPRWSTLKELFKKNQSTNRESGRKNAESKT
ncbi:MAG: DUF177 domain-containing protein [Candidatus Manganitrophaceae bacterium]